MAVTQQFKDDVLEVLNEVGYAAEQEETIITSLDNLDEDTTLPGIIRVNGVLTGYTMLSLPVIKAYLDDKYAVIQTQWQGSDGTGGMKKDVSDATAAANEAAEDAEGADNVDATVSEVTQSNGTIAVILTVTDRDGVSVSKEVGFRIANTYISYEAMLADALNVDQGRFVMISSDTSTDNGKLYVKSGDSFAFVANLCGPQGDPLTYADLTAAQIAELQRPATEAAQTANTAAQSANTAAQAANTAAIGAENVNAEISGMTVTITNRQGTATSINIGFEIVNTYASIAAMNADAVNVAEGKFVMIATTDPTSADNAKLYLRNSNPATSAEPFSFMSDLDQASSAAWADWLNNMKPQIESAISTAGDDHTQAVSDHNTASSDHTTAGTDHTNAAADHTQAGTDHQTASDDHTQAGTDHTRAEADHTTAESDHGYAAADHTEWVGEDGESGMKKDIEDATENANTAAASVETELSKLTGDLYPRFEVNTTNMTLVVHHVDQENRFAIDTGGYLHVNV